MDEQSKYAIHAAAREGRSKSSHARPELGRVTIVDTARSKKQKTKPVANRLLSYF